MYRVPTVMEKHGEEWKKSCHEKSWKMSKTNKVMEIQKGYGRVMEFLTAYRESRMRNSDNSISMGVLPCFGYGRLSVYLLLNLKGSFFEAAVGSLPNFARVCGYRRY